MSTFCSPGSPQCSGDVLFGAGESVWARWRLGGTQVGAHGGIAATDREIDVEQREVHEVAGAVVVESWVYGDARELFRQIASSPDGAPVR